MFSVISTLICQGRERRDDFASYANNFYAKGRRPFYIGCFNFLYRAELRWIGDCKSALTAASSDATRLLISMETLINTMINKILGDQ